MGIEKGKCENLNRFYEAMNIEEHKSMNRKNYIKCDYFTRLWKNLDNLWPLKAWSKWLISKSFVKNSLTIA